MGKEGTKKLIGKIFLGAYISVTWAGATSAAVLLKNYLEERKQEAKEVPIEETVKNELLQEYKSIFLKDKNLKLVFTEQELNETMEEQIKSIKIAEVEGGWSGGYYTQKKKIIINPECYKLYREEVLFHEITHGVFTRGDYETGFRLMGYTGFINREFFSKGTGLNEGATEYIAQKLLEDTSYNNYVAYKKNVEIIKHLCITYGEEFIFKALKEGPQVLAERLEKDGVSYNELSEVMDEMTTIKYQKKQQQLAERAEKIARDLLVKKYKQATPEERLEIANRAREIQAEQRMEKGKIDVLRGPERQIELDKDPIKMLESTDYDPVYAINIDMYKNYMKNNRFVLNIDPEDIEAISSAINTAILGTNNIAINDIKNIEIAKFNHTSIADGYAYVIKLKEDLKMYLTNLREITGDFNPDTDLEEMECEKTFKVGDVIVDKSQVKQNVFKKTVNKVKKMLNKNKTKLLPEGKQSNTAIPGNLYVDDGDVSKGGRIQPPIDDSQIIYEDNTRAPQGFYSTKDNFTERYKVNQKELHGKQPQNKQHHKQDEYER